MAWRGSLAANSQGGRWRGTCTRRRRRRPGTMSARPAPHPSPCGQHPGPPHRRHGRWAGWLAQLRRRARRWRRRAGRGCGEAWPACPCIHLLAQAATDAPAAFQRPVPRVSPSMLLRPGLRGGDPPPPGGASSAAFGGLAPAEGGPPAVGSAEMRRAPLACFWAVMEPADASTPAAAAAAAASPAAATTATVGDRCGSGGALAGTAWSAKSSITTVTMASWGWGSAAAPPAAPASAAVASPSADGCTRVPPEPCRPSRLRALDSLRIMPRGNARGGLGGRPACREGTGQ